jgi:hypothetical protein
LRIDVAPDEATEIVPCKVRLLSIATGFFTAIAGSLLMGPFFSIWPAILVLGAIVQPYWRHFGRGLMLSGALFLSAWATLFVVGVLHGIRQLRHYHDLNSRGVLSSMLASVILVSWCDVALVISEIKMRRAQRPGSTKI